MEDARALLDSLMGPARDKKRKEGEAAEGFLEKNVCRRFLAGCCPNELFKSTKREMEVCPKIHSESLAAELKAHPKGDKHTANFEEECMEYLESIRRDAERWVKREQGNLRGERKEFQPTAGQQRSLSDLSQRYKDAMAQCGKHEEDGEIEKAKISMEAANSLKRDLDDLKEKCHVDMGAEIVCELCGVRYPTGDGERERGHRDAHLAGKLHEAYGIIRDHAAELRKKKNEREEARSSKNKKEDKDDKDKEKDEDGEDKGKKRDRSRSKDKDKDKGRRRRSRSRSRRDKRRSRSRRRR